MHGLFFLHRHTFERLLEVKKYAPDVALLKSRTRAALGAMLQECLLQNAGKVKIRLFSNMSQEFRVEAWHTGGELRRAPGTELSEHQTQFCPTDLCFC